MVEKNNFIKPIKGKIFYGLLMLFFLFFLVWGIWIGYFLFDKNNDSSSQLKKIKQEWNSLKISSKNKWNSISNQLNQKLVNLKKEKKIDHQAKIALEKKLKAFNQTLEELNHQLNQAKTEQAKLTTKRDNALQEKNFFQDKLAKKNKKISILKKKLKQIQTFFYRLTTPRESEWTRITIEKLLEQAIKIINQKD